MDVVTVDWATVSTDQELAEEMAEQWLTVFDVCDVIKEWPRRLGGGATSSMLTVDKKLARKVQLLAQIQHGWWLGLKKDWPGLPRVFPATARTRQIATAWDWTVWLPAQTRQAELDARAYAAWLERNGIFSTRAWVFQRLEKDLLRHCKFAAERLGNEPEAAIFRAAVDEDTARNLAQMAEKPVE